MIEMDDMRCFVEVVESGGFGRAARLLGISKSMVSRRIARMEADLGARLLTRTTRGIDPTEAGLEFKARSERILSEFDQARDAVAGQDKDLTGRLRLSAPQAFGIRHVAPIVADMARLHPGLEIDVSYSDRLVDLVGERYDAAIRVGLLEDSSLIARRIAPVRSVVVAGPAYIERNGRPETPADLAAHECLIFTGRPTTDWPFRSGRRAISFRPNGRLRSDSAEMIVQWAVAGLGIAAGPFSYLVSDAIESGALVSLLDDYVIADEGIHVLRPPGAYVPRKVRVLTDILVERFGGVPHWDRCLMHHPLDG